MPKKLSILIVDDEPRVLDELEEFLSSRKYKVYTADRPTKAFKVLDSMHVNIMILDVKLPEMSGLDVLTEVKKKHPDIEVIMISGHGDMDTVIQAMRNGATDYFQKPFRLLDVDNSITRTKRFIELSNQLKSANSALGVLSNKLLENIGSQLIGDSIEMKNLVELMNKVAKASNTSVLILGESGTGKELVAHGIHYLSQRLQHAFYSVNCSAIPETLFESEFFGHKKGAFTGANADKNGWFETADKGTLFLDEISDMPLGQQAKLLRVLEERKVSKLGSTQSKSVDVRVIAASNKDLEVLAEQNKFRLDLYHRLSIFVIEIPPLRKRVDDIPMLLDHYMKHYANQMEKNIVGIDNNTVRLLKKHSFPGNIRELKNIMERAVIMCEESIIKLEHVTFKGKEDLVRNDGVLVKSDNNKPINQEVAAKSEELLPSITTFDIDESNKALIKRALEVSGNNKAKAAELLNVTWQSLNRRMKKFEIE